MVLISQRDQCFGPMYNVIFSSSRNFKTVLFNHFNALLESNVHVSKKANAAVVVEKKYWTNINFLRYLQLYMMIKFLKEKNVFRNILLLYRTVRRCMFVFLCMQGYSRVIQTTCSYMYCNTCKYVTSVYMYRKRTFTVRTVLLDFTYLNY